MYWKLETPDVSAPMLDWAIYWARSGWPVFPLKPGEKVPLISREKGGDSFKSGTTDEDQIRAWWSETPNANIGATPPANWVAVDFDGVEPDGWPETRQHRTPRPGNHLFYVDIEGRVPQGKDVFGKGIDTRVSGKGYVVLPPSKITDYDGRSYEVLRDDRVPAAFPYERLNATVQGRAKPGRKNPNRDPALKLLTLPRDDDSLGDDAMLTIAGFVARRMRTKDEFEAVMWAINQSLADPLDDSAMAKKLWTWDQEQAKFKRAIDEAPGWLIESPGDTYLTAIEVAGIIEQVVVSDFRLKVRGVIRYPDRKTWIVDIHYANGGVLEGQHLTSDDTASSARLTRWLHGRECALFPHQSDKRGALGSRLLASILAQDFPELSPTDHYGWHTDHSCFLVPDGELTADSLRPHTTLFPDARLRDQFAAVYGGVDQQSEALEVLREVLTFQRPEDTAILGAWLVMLVLRGQWQGLMPGLLVAGHSGSGKTTFLKLLCELCGSPQHGGKRTNPIVRDSLRGNLNGVVWLDDVRIDDTLQEMLRAAITGGEYLLKDQDLNTKRVPLRAGIMLSGESVAFGQQKAIRERFISVELSDPTSRRSVIDPNKSQYLDILALKQRYEGSLANVAGGLVQAILAKADMLEELPSLLAHATRQGEAQAVIRMGGKILTSLLGDPTYERHIERWAELNPGAPNMAGSGIMHVFPELWRQSGFPERREGTSSGAMGGYPIYRNASTGLFMVNVKTCASKWLYQRRGLDGARERELTSEDALGRELTACGAGKGVSHKPHGLRYREIPARYSKMIEDVAVGAHGETPD